MGRPAQTSSPAGLNGRRLRNSPATPYPLTETLQDAHAFGVDGAEAYHDQHGIIHVPEAVVAGQRRVADIGAENPAFDLFSRDPDEYDYNGLEKLDR